MRQGTYLNVILSINAVLLTVLVWTQLASPDAPAPSQAIAQSQPYTGGVPNSGEQRLRMIRSLDALRKTVDGMAKQLESGDLKVSVENLNEIEIRLPD